MLQHRAALAELRFAGHQCLHLAVNASQQLFELLFELQHRRGQFVQTGQGLAYRGSTYGDARATL